MAWFRLRPRKSQLGVPRQSPVVPIDFDIDEPAASDQAWLNSTLELRSGLTVIEHPFDTLPGELQEELATALDASKRRR